MSRGAELWRLNQKRDEFACGKIEEMMTIRAALAEDRDAVWLILEPILRAGEVYALPGDLSREEALAYWFSTGHEVFVAESHDAVAGTYYLRANQRGGGSHVANLWLCNGGKLARTRHRRSNVCALTRASAEPGLSRDAVQFRRQHERGCRAPLAAPRISDRWHAARGVPASGVGVCRCVCDASRAVKWNGAAERPVH